MNRGYIVDKDFKLKKERMSVWTVVRKILTFFVATISMAIVYYVLFALVFSTEEERVLRLENRLYEEEYPLMHEKEKLLSDVVEGLKVKDDMIYEEIFNMAAPNMEQFSSLDFLMGLDSIPDSDIVIRAAGRLDHLEASADRVEENFARVMEVLAEDDFVMPPMTNPLKDFTFAQTGASVGDKINPFYKVPMKHNGLDLIAPAGEPVYAVADGVVKEVIKSRKGLGNVVVVDHGNGYRTRYAHLADIEVRKGRKVKRGTRLGYVGVSGNSFAPHLHYEVLRDTLVMDPVNHFFASVTPMEYMNMLIMSVSTGQSMD
jgi:hypothetical protein